MRYSDAMYREVFPEVKPVAVQSTMDRAVEPIQQEDNKAIEPVAVADQEVQTIETVVEPVVNEVENGHNGCDSAVN